MRNVSAENSGEIKSLSEEIPLKPALIIRRISFLGEDFR